MSVRGLPVRVCAFPSDHSDAEPVEHYTEVEAALMRFKRNQDFMDELLLPPLDGGLPISRGGR
jgi:hypothetical protein